MIVNSKVLVGQFVSLFLFFTVPLFLAAGTITWLAGWIFVVLFFTFTATLTLWLLRHNPGLLKERMTMFSPDQKVWDKVGFMLMDVIFLAIAGAIVLIGSFPLFIATFRENSYLSPMVRIQKDRGQTVVSTGPYHYVRHPMYAAALLFLLGTTLLLGSGFGLLLGLILVGMIAGRAVLEERTLQKELQDYDSYMVQVKYRFIPYIW
jgi:protein-S-isoprenylcysteine O-methyltransferase Ste14